MAKHLVGCVPLRGTLRSVEKNVLKVVLDKGAVKAELPYADLPGVDLKALVGKRVLFVVDLVVTGTGGLWPEVTAVLVGRSPWLSENTLQRELMDARLEQEGRPGGARSPGQGGQGRGDDSSGGAAGSADVPRSRRQGTAPNPRAEGDRGEAGGGSASDDRRGGSSDERVVPSSDGEIVLERGGKTYAARITGTDSKYGLKRVFVELRDRKSDRPRFLPTEDGIYEVSDAKGRRYLVVLDGRVACEERSVKVIKTSCEMLEDGASLRDVVEVLRG